MSDSDFIRDFLSHIVDAEMADADHWLLTDVYYRAIRLHTHYERFWDGYEYGSADRSVVYDWWAEFLDNSVSNEFMRKYMNENLYDEHVFHFLHAIHDKYETHIEKHYADVKKEYESEHGVKCIGAENAPACNAMVKGGDTICDKCFKYVEQ